MKFFRLSLGCAFFISCATLSCPADCGASDTASFYTFNERWEKRKPGQSKSDALDEGFGSALNRQGVTGSSEPSKPSAIRRDLSEMLSQGSLVEIELDQSLFLKSAEPIVKFISTDDGIVLMETVDSDTLHLVGTQVGSTFVHIWDASGRKTFSVRVIQPKFVPSQKQIEQKEALEGARPFRFWYDNSRSAFYTGEKYRVARRSSLDFNQSGSFSGDTPYGELAGHATTQKNRGKNQLTDAQMSLRDGHVGRIDNFNAAVGDSSVSPGLMVFPQARVRGVALEKWDEKENVKVSGFYGREESGILGTLTPGIVSKRTRDSWLSGAVLDYRLGEAAKMKTGFFDGFGQSRAHELNRRGYGNLAQINFGKHFGLDSEIDFDNEHFAQKHALAARFEKLQVRNEFRDISKKFYTLLGAVSRQGELGNQLEIAASPFNWWTASGTLDVFRDRLVFNPEDPSRANIHLDLQTTFTPDDASSLVLSFQDLDDKGRVGPTKQRVYGVQYNRRIQVWGHRAGWFARYQNRNNRVMQSDLSDYVRDQIALGFYVPLFWGIHFSAQKEVSRVDEVNLMRLTYPHATTYNLDYSRQIDKTPFSIDARLRIRDEEQTESPLSFMSGEDLTEVSGGLTYRPSQDVEVYLNGSFSNYTAESLAVLSPRVEYQFLTGVHYLYDTGWRWTTVGAFKGAVFKDINGNGSRDPGEPGIPGMIIRTHENKEAVTDEQGAYAFEGVSGKNAVITMDTSKIPYGYAPTGPLRVEIPVLQNQTQEVRFGLTPRSELSGIIFNDLNGNGKYDTAEPGVRKIKIALEDGQATRTNGLGVYSFPGITAGEHTASLVMTTLPEGYLPQDVPKKNFKVTEGIKYELHFPLRAIRAVTGRVFVEQNKNGAFDGGEKTVAGARVFLGSLSVVSDAEGWYLFDGLNEGRFELRVDPATLPAGMMPSASMMVELPTGPLTIQDKNISVERA